MLSLALQVALTLPPSLEAVCDPKDAQSCVQPLLRGQRAPFSGQLLTNWRAAKLQVANEQHEERLAAAVKRVTDMLQADIDRLTVMRENDKVFHKIEVDLVLKSLEEAHKAAAVPWHRQPVWVAIFTIAGTSLVYIGAVETVKALK